MDASAKVEEKPRESSGRQRFRQAATTVAQLCGLVLSRKRYIERSPLVQWAKFHLKNQKNLRSDLLFSVSDYSKKQFNKGFEKLKHLLCICPRQRKQQDLLQIQACLKTNRAFQCLPSKTQLQLCQAFIYQEYDAGTIIIRQGHVATECYLVLSGKLKVMMADANSNAKSFTPETLCEAGEGDFIGETCLLTNTKRPASVICKSDAELLVMDKENFKYILADLQYEQHHATCHFLRKLPIFSTWPLEKIEFLVHCSLRRFYRAGTTVITDSLDSYFLIIVKSGRCIEAAKLGQETIATQHGDCKISPVTFSEQKMNFTGQLLKTSWKTTYKYKSEKQWPQVVQPSTCVCAQMKLTEKERCNAKTAAIIYHSPVGRKDFSDLKEKGLIRRDDGIKITQRKKKVALLTPRFLKIRSLEQSDIFGLAEIMDKLCIPQLSLISEGAECIFIPKNVFLKEASAKSRRIALEIVSSYPTEQMIQDSYIIQQTWSTYKTRLIQQQLERRARSVSASIHC
ncbi:cyclic nucleotide-binding domain-containing protein 2-like isoform X2 [Hemicordylus capensis]|uniref:cyclic nucleotide-binding domain-containing protein 2-like isoform X2 n=1 Tax=Hemicordylus capensis TaxID=884348 RepID=UPI00230201B0|nr:cyclic nucleotide-binding domain-containing protein 2-like isoform X2 [Hemicordylus capensis]